MQRRSGRWRRTLRNWTMPGNSPQCLQVRRALRQKSGGWLSRRRDGHSEYTPANRFSRVWHYTPSVCRPGLAPCSQEPHGIGRVRVGPRCRDTVTETARLWFAPRGRPEPTTSNLCTSCTAASAGTSTARAVRISFSAVAQHVRAASRGWVIKRLLRVARLPVGRPRAVEPHGLLLRSIVDLSSSRPPETLTRACFT